MPRNTSDSAVFADLAPTKADRLLAAAAYLGLLLGLWLVAPVAIYLYRRQESRFVAHHAARAALLHLACLALLVLCSLLLSLLTLALATSPSTTALLVYALLAWLGGLLPYLASLVVLVLAAVRASQGREDRTTRLGRAVEWLLRHDRAVARAPASTPGGPTGSR